MRKRLLTSPSKTLTCLLAASCFIAYDAINIIALDCARGAVLQVNADATDEGRTLLLLISSDSLTFVNVIAASQFAVCCCMGIIMLKYAIIFALISLVAGALGFGGIAAGSAGIAKILFGLFLILAVIFIVLAALGVGAAKKALE